MEINIHIRAWYGTATLRGIAEADLMYLVLSLPHVNVLTIQHTARQYVVQCADCLRRHATSEYDVSIIDIG